MLGEIGVGKSTWINGFANYPSFSSVEEAKNHNLVSLIPSSFVLINGNFEEQEITTGSNKNENTASGTQLPKTYNFPYDDITVRLIDTPGIGSTRGIGADKKIFQQILSHLSTFEEIHEICILLKPNSARLTVMLQFCIKELLIHLHRDAAKKYCFLLYQFTKHVLPIR